MTINERRTTGIGFSMACAKPSHVLYVQVCATLLLAFFCKSNVSSRNIMFGKKYGIQLHMYSYVDGFLVNLLQMGQEEICASGTSYLDRTEVANAEKLVNTFLRSGVVPSQVYAFLHILL